jgi:hypothetical protein
MSEWPNAWLIDEPDRTHGQGLLEEITPFVAHLVNVEQLSGTTIRRHLEYLFPHASSIQCHLPEATCLSFLARAPNPLSGREPVTAGVDLMPLSPLRFWTQEYR